MNGYAFHGVSESELEAGMISRERVKRAIHFQGVDHIPHFLPDGKIARLTVTPESRRQDLAMHAPYDAAI